MLVTGVQPVGAKGVTTVQATAVDVKDATRAGVTGDHDADRHHAPTTAKPGEPQPVVFPRNGVPVDQRPVSMQHEHAARRYRRDGAPPQHDDAA